MYDHLETAFKQRYIQPSVLRFISACELFGKKQRSDESVDAYVSRLRTLSKKVDVDDKALLYALLSGLKSPMASYVLGKNPQMFAEAVVAARLAEFSVVEGASHAYQQLCTQLAEMRQDIQKLAQRYDRFKARRSTNMCTMVLKKTISNYTAHRSSVYCTMLDATKAFDRVKYTKLFECLWSGAYRLLC